MKQKLGCILGTLLLLGVLYIIVTSITPCRLWLHGLVLGDPFFRGRPARSWVEELRSLDRQREKEAFQALEQGGLEAVPVLILAMDESDSISVQAGQMIKAHDQAGVPLLIQALKNSRDTTVRANVCRLLLQLGPAAKAAMPALIEAARKDENDYVRFLAASAAYVIDPEQERAAGLPSPPTSNEPPQRQ
jgi:hypothetical protein